LAAILAQVEPAEHSRISQVARDSFPQDAVESPGVDTIRIVEVKNLQLVGPPAASCRSGTLGETCESR